MAKENSTPDPLGYLANALEPELAKVEATVEFSYSPNGERGSMNINRHGKAMQTSYFSSGELQTLRDGGTATLEKQKQAILDQINRLLNPPRPTPISLTGMMPARRGRTATKKPEAEAATEAGTDTETATATDTEGGAEVETVEAEE